MSYDSLKDLDLKISKEEYVKRHIEAMDYSDPEAFRAMLPVMTAALERDYERLMRLGFIIFDMAKLRQLVSTWFCLECEYACGDMEGNGHCSLDEQLHYDSTICPKDKFINGLCKILREEDPEE